MGRPGVARLLRALRTTVHAESRGLRGIRRFSCLLMRPKTGLGPLFPMNRPTLRPRRAWSTIFRSRSRKKLGRLALARLFQLSPKINPPLRGTGNLTPRRRSSNFPARRRFPSFMRTCLRIRSSIVRVSSKPQRSCLLHPRSVESSSNRRRRRCPIPVPAVTFESNLLPSPDACLRLRSTA